MTSERDKARRWWQFSIREVLLCTFIVAIGAGWQADRTRLERVHRRATEEANRRYAKLEQRFEDLEELGAALHDLGYLQGR